MIRLYESCGWNLTPHTPTGSELSLSKDANTKVEQSSTRRGGLAQGAELSGEGPKRDPDRKFDIRVRGRLPEDLAERISELHATAIGLRAESNTKP